MIKGGWASVSIWTETSEPSELIIGTGRQYTTSTGSKRAVSNTIKQCRWWLAPPSLAVSCGRTRLGVIKTINHAKARGGIKNTGVSRSDVSQLEISVPCRFFLIGNKFPSRACPPFENAEKQMAGHNSLKDFRRRSLAPLCCGSWAVARLVDVDVDPRAVPPVV